MGAKSTRRFAPRIQAKTPRTSLDVPNKKVIIYLVAKGDAEATQGRRQDEPNETPGQKWLGVFLFPIRDVLAQTNLGLLFLSGGSGAGPRLKLIRILPKYSL